MRGHNHAVRAAGAGRLCGLHELAAGALQSLSWKNVRHRDGLRECGGVAALVGLLARGGSAALHTRAAGTLMYLTSERGQSWEAVRACGGVAALERMLACPSSAAAHEWAATALRDLGRAQQGGKQEPRQRWPHALQAYGAARACAARRALELKAPAVFTAPC